MSETIFRCIVECHKSGELITVLSPFEGGATRLVDVPVIAVDQAAQKFQVKREGDDIGKWFAIRHILGIRRAGIEIPSPSGKAYWETIQDRREKRADWHTELNDFSHTPNVSLAPHGVRAKVVGESYRIPGPPGSKRDVEMVCIQGWDKRLTHIEVKDAQSAQRVCGLAGESYWITAHA